MQASTSTFVFMIFLVVAFTEFFGEAVHDKTLIFFTKPLLLPLLAMFYALRVGNRWNKAHRLMMPAFLFSWVGDVSLMLTPEHPEDVMIMGITKNKYHFFVGLGGFLLAHLFFIRVYLLSMKDKAISLLHSNKWVFLPILLYWGAMLYIIVPAVLANEEKRQAVIPVIIYASILATMTALALNRFRQVSPSSFWLVLLGSVSFLFSDSVIAINFLVLERPIPPLSLVIITTYVLAETCIALGILKEHDAPPESAINIP